MELRHDRDREAVRAAESNAAFDRFAMQNTGFILRCASKATHRFITISDDEYAVALEAFYEAVQSYGRDKGPFNAFAALVIRRRLVDMALRQKKRAGEIPIGSSFDWEGQESEQPGLISAVQREIAAQSTARQDTAKDEIEALSMALKKYGFDFFSLAEASPKAGKTKDACASAVRCLMDQPLLLQLMRRKGQLPMAELSQLSGVSKKILERHRRYIIAAAEILTGDYPHLADYMKYISKGK